MRVTSLALYTKKYKMSHCVFTHLLWWFCTMSIYPSWNYISPNSHPVWLLVKKGLREKFAQDLEDTSEVSTLKVATKHQALWQFIPVVPRVLAHGEEARPTVLPAGYPPPVSSSPACLSAQSCLTLCDPMDNSPPGSSVSWIFQARILEWVAISFLQGIFSTQGLNLCLKCLLHWQTDSLPLVPYGKCESWVHCICSFMTKALTSSRLQDIEVEDSER